MTSETRRSVPTLFPEEAKDASVSECTWTLSALEALRNGLYKFKTYLLTYLHIEQYEVGTLAVNGWAITFGTARKELCDSVRLVGCGKDQVCIIGPKAKALGV